MDILDKAKKQGLQINGKPVKGKTGDLIDERFGISHYTAQKLIRKAKEQGGEEEEGAKFSYLFIMKIVMLHESSHLVR